jgi:uncharacterized protein YbjT (DUF2867 family)
VTSHPDYGLSRVRSAAVGATLDLALDRHPERLIMKVVVIGGTGLIGSKVVSNVTRLGHEASAASPQTGVNTITGEGLAEAVAGAQVVVDVSNSPSFDDEPVMHFFTTSTTNLLEAERTAGVGHHVALSVVGAERVPDSGYLRAKAAQQRLIKDSGVPYSIVAATQFYEFVNAIADSATDGNTVRLPHALMQPIAAEDVATAVTRAAVGSPANEIIEIAGPEKIAMDDLIRISLSERDDPREVVADPQARYYGAVIDDHAIVPGEGATIFETRFADWLASHSSNASR